MTTLAAVRSWNEWDRLEEVIVGRAENARYPLPDVSSRFVLWRNHEPDADLPTGRFPEWVVHEAVEDLEALAAALELFGANVRRPEIWPHERIIANPHWKASGYSNYCPRDVLLVYGDQIIESPNAIRGRTFETLSYRSLLNEYSERGARWISAPRPALVDSAYAVDSEYPAPADVEPIFDAANVLRMGKDILYQISVTGNRRGARWLRSILEEDTRIHLVERLYSGSHLDSTIAMLRPGLVLLNPSRVSEETIPLPIRKWDRIWCPPIEGGPQSADGATHPPMGSEWIEMNVLSLDENTVVVDSDQIVLMQELESRGLTVIPLKLRHGRLLGGGFHCVTLDVRRSGELEDYLN